MKYKKPLFLLVGISVLGLAACEATPVKKEEQFWQRRSMSEAVYAQGPKAQQLLDRDIARCVYELRELEGLNTIKNAIPTDQAGRVLDPDEKALYDWDTPERHENLYAEHSNYMDFESCMMEKGWERVAHVPFDVAARGRDNYKKAKVNYDPIKDTKKPIKKRTTSNEVGDFSELND